MARHYKSKAQGYGMLHDDRNAPCNLPRNVIQREYPMPGAVMAQGKIGNLYTGVEQMMYEDTKEMGKIFRPRKY